MDYKKGVEVLPARLLREIQEYVDGSLVYIPKKSGKAGWGYVSGARADIDRRNEKIRLRFRQGETVGSLSGRYHLEEDTIKKIIYRKKQL